MRCLILECRDLARTQLQRQLDRFADTVCVGARPAAGQDDPWHGTSPPGTSPATWTIACTMNWVS